MADHDTPDATWPQPTMLTGAIMLALSVWGLIASLNIVMIIPVLAAAIMMLVGALAVIADAVSWKQHIVASAALLVGFAVFFVTNLDGIAGLIVLSAVVGLASALARTALTLAAFGFCCATLASIVLLAD